MPLGPFFGPPFERNSTSIFSFELRNWIKNGPDGRKTEDGRTHMIFWDLPYTISPSGNNVLHKNFLGVLSMELLDISGPDKVQLH